MALYRNTNANSLITHVEFTPVADGNFAFIYARPDDNKEELKQWLTSKEVGQEIIAETQVNGKSVFVTHGETTKDAFAKKLEEHGEKLQLQVHKKKFNAWAWRGNMSNVGQILQVMSAAMKPKGIDTATMTFGLSNLAANMTNLIFGGEVREDVHGERALKGKINQGLSSYLAGDDPFPEVDDRIGKRLEAKDPPSAGDKAYSFMKQNSVKIGEVGMRYFGAFNMMAPLFKSKQEWKVFGDALKGGKMGEAWKAFRNPDKANFWVGVLYLFGKSLALTSKVPDPYDPTPKTALDEFREKYAFKVSSVIEGLGAGTIAMTRLKAGSKVVPGKVFDKVGLKFGNTQWNRDYLGGIGGLLFMGGFAIRLAAPFGTRKMDMDEIYAHATDTLAKTPPDQLPQLLAETAATVTEHFKDKNLEYGKVFSMMMQDLYHYHHIALDNLGTEPNERAARTLSKCIAGIPPEQRNERSMAQCLDGVAAGTPQAADAGQEEAPQTANTLAKCVQGIPPEKLSERSMLQCLDGVAAGKPDAVKQALATPRRTAGNLAAAMPVSSFAEKAAKSADAPAIPNLGA